MARTTATEVKEILDTDLDDSIVEAFIVGANALVTEVLGETDLGDTLLEEIERWLTAHMIASTRKRMAAEEGAGGAYIKYTGKFDKNLASTPYGQQALVLDATGNMAKLGTKAARLIAVTSFD